MKQVRKRLTYANVMSSIAVFLVLGGATAIAASKIGTKQLKANSVTTGKIKKNAVTTAKIRNNAVTGVKLNEATLGTVPSATTAGTASSLAGQTPFYIRIGFGQSQTIASHGVVSLVANCRQAGGNDIAEILMQTTQNGAVANGEDDFTGNTPAEFLNVDTAATSRQFSETNISSGETYASEEYDEGYLLGPDNKMLSANAEGIAVALNYGGSGCLFAGIVNAIN